MAVFKITFLRPILNLSKFIGLINLSYTMDKSGFIVKNTGTTYYMFLEIIRMIILITCTYNIFHDQNFPFIQMILLMKFWTVFISARISQMWIIKYEFYELSILNNFNNACRKNKNFVYLK